jgi:hypothetical protein
MTVQIRFWWPGYSPEEALDSLDPVVTETPFEVSRDGGRVWRSPLNGSTLQTVYEWMLDQGLSVVDTKLVGRRRNGRWEGRYVLTIGLAPQRKEVADVQRRAGDN